MILLLALALMDTTFTFVATDSIQVSSPPAVLYCNLCQEWEPESHKHTLLTLEDLEAYLEWCERDSVVVPSIPMIYYDGNGRMRQEPYRYILVPRTPSLPGFLQWMKGRK